MDRGLLVLMTLAALSGCCKKSGTTPTKGDAERMDEFIELMCARNEECMSDEMKASTSYMAGGNCETDLRSAMIEFSDDGLPSPCDEGESFRRSYAPDCFDQIRAASCDVIVEGAWDTGDCAMMCR